MIKAFFKKYLPASWWRILFLGRKYLHQSRRFHPETSVFCDLLVFVRSVFRNVVPLTAKLDLPGHDIKIAVDSPVSLMRSHACHKEPETVRWIEEWMKDGGVFYDIGANIGAYSLVTDAISGGRARIFAFEPEAGSFLLLNKNIRLNGAGGRIAPFCLALSDRSGLLRVELSAPEAGSADHRLFEANDLESSMGDGTISAMRLDDAIASFGLPAPDLIKIDVDGGERGVIAGMSSLMKTAKLRSILIEMIDDSADQKWIHDAILAAGFHLAAKHQRGKGRDLFNFIYSRIKPL